MKSGALILKKPIDSTESIESTIDKKSFISIIKNIAKNHLCEIAKSYKDEKFIKPADDFLILLNNVFKSDANYQQLETDLIKQRKKLLLVTNEHKSGYFTPLIAAHYFLIGICQLAQDNNNEAQKNFHECFSLCDHKDLELVSIIAATYSCLCNKLNTDKLIKSHWFCSIYNKAVKDMSTRPNNLLNSYQQMFANKINACSQNNKDKEAKTSDIQNVVKLLSEWEKEIDNSIEKEKKFKEIQGKLINTKYNLICYCENTVLFKFYSALIINQLKECINIKKKDKNTLRDHYKSVANSIIDALKLYHFSFNSLIDEVINKINNPNLYPPLKVVLKQILEQINNDDMLFTVCHGDKDIKYALSRLDMAKAKEKLTFTISIEQFIKSAKELVQPMLEELSNAIKTDKKAECLELIKQFYDNTETAQQLFERCHKLIFSLFQDKTFAAINNEHGPILDVLYYIAGMCQLSMSDDKDFKCKLFYLNEALYKPSSLIEDHLRLLRGLMRLKKGWLPGGRYDLEKIPDDSSCHNLKDILISDITKYLKLYPFYDLPKNEKIATTLKELEEIVLNNNDDYSIAIAKQAEFENYLKYKFHMIHEVDYNTCMTILYFKIRALATEARCNKVYLNHLIEALTDSFEVTHTLFRLQEALAKIYGDNDKIYLQSLLDDILSIMTSDEEADTYGSLIFQKFVVDYFAPKFIEEDKEILSEATDHGEDINKCDFINQAKELARPHIEKAVNKFDDKIIKLANDFFTIKDLNDESLKKYEQIENECIDYLKIMLKRVKRYMDVNESFYWHPAISSLYYIIGTCQLAQNKNIQAQFNLDECFAYLEDPTDMLAKLTMVYASLMNDNLEKDMLIKAKCYFTENEFHEEDFTNNNLKKLFNQLNKKVKSHLNTNTTTTEYSSAQDDAHKLYEIWKSEKDEKNAIKYQDDIIKNIVHYNSNEILNIYTRIIKNQLEEFATTLEKQNGVIPEDQKECIVDILIRANNHISFNLIIQNIVFKMLQEANHKDAYLQMHGIKIILESVRDKLKITNLLNCTLCYNQDINANLHDVQERMRVKFDLNISNDAFIQYSKTKSKPILEEMCQSIEYKNKECKELLNEFFNTQDYYKLRIDTDKLINEIRDKKLFSEISKKHKATLDLLYYINSICQIAIHAHNNYLNFNNVYLNEALYKSSTTEIKDLLLLNFAYLDLKRNLMIPGMEKIQEISVSSVCKEFKMRINNQVITYTLENPSINDSSINIGRNEALNTLLKNLRIAILNGEHDVAFELKEAFEKYDENEIHWSYDAEYHFWMAILYFKLRGKNNDESNKHNEMLEIYLRKALKLSGNFVDTLFKFTDTISQIYKDSDLEYIKLFNNDYEQVIDLGLFRDFRSLYFEKFINDYCKKANKPVNKSVDSKIIVNKPIVNQPIINISRTEEKTKNKMDPKKPETTKIINPNQKAGKSNPQKRKQLQLSKADKQKMAKESELININDEIRVEHTNINKAKQKISKLKSEMTTLGANVYEIETINKRKDEMISIAEEVERLKNIDLRKENEDIAKVKQGMIDIERKIASIDKDIQLKSDEIRKIEENKANLAAKINTTNQEISKIQGKISERKQQKLKLEAELKKAEQKTDDDIVAKVDETNNDKVEITDVAQESKQQINETIVNKESNKESIKQSDKESDKKSDKKSDYEMLDAQGTPIYNAKKDVNETRSKIQILRDILKLKSEEILVVQGEIQGKIDAINNEINVTIQSKNKQEQDKLTYENELSTLENNCSNAIKAINNNKDEMIRITADVDRLKAFDITKDDTVREKTKQEIIDIVSKSTLIEKNIRLKADELRQIEENKIALNSNLDLINKEIGISKNKIDEQTEQKLKLETQLGTPAKKVSVASKKTKAKNKKPNVVSTSLNLIQPQSEIIIKEPVKALDIDSSKKDIIEIEKQAKNVKETLKLKSNEIRLAQIDSINEKMRILKEEIKRLEEIEATLANDRKMVQFINQKTDRLARLFEKKDKVFTIENDITKTNDVIKEEQHVLKTIKSSNLSNSYLREWFSKPNDFNLLVSLNSLAESIDKEVIFKGSSIAKLTMQKGDSEAINFSNNMTFKDIDVYIDCIDSNYQHIVDELIKNNFEFKNSDYHYINFNKTLQNGLILDLTLKIKPKQTIDPFPITRGIAKLLFPYTNYPVLIMIKDQDYKLFKKSCIERIMEIDKPELETIEVDYTKPKLTSYAYRLYKCIKRYGGIINITNLDQVKAELYNFYMNSLALNKITIYLELSDFVTHGVLDQNDKDAVELLELIFKAFFDSNSNANVDVNKFVDFFISCKDYLYYENKKVFKEQVDLIRTLYLQKYELDDVRNEIKNLKDIYHQSISQNTHVELKQEQRQGQAYTQPPQVNAQQQIQSNTQASQEVLQINYEYQQKMLKATFEFKRRVLDAAQDYYQKMLQNSQPQVLPAQNVYQVPPAQNVYIDPYANVFPNPYSQGHSVYPNASPYPYPPHENLYPYPNVSPFHYQQDPYQQGQGNVYPYPYPSPNISPYPYPPLWQGYSYPYANVPPYSYPQGQSENIHSENRGGGRTNRGRGNRGRDNRSRGRDNRGGARDNFIGNSRLSGNLHGFHYQNLNTGSVQQNLSRPNVAVRPANDTSVPEVKGNTGAK